MILAGYAYISLQSAEQMTQERMFDTKSQNFSLNHHTLNVIILKNSVFTQNFDSVEILRISQLCQ